MTRTALLDELRHGKPFASLAEEAFLDISRTAAELQEGIDRVLKPYGVSATQYNVLRILRGAAPKGLCRHEIRDRLLTRMPDVTRLLDRMEEAELVTRERDTADRRLVTTRLTDRGRDLVDALDGPVAEEHERRFGHVDAKQLRTLTRLLTRVRHPA
jgi:DNA-binding MarR family transcriptional regulator